MATARSKDYGYTNARIRAMKSDLLGPDIYEHLIKAEDIVTAIRILEGTPYEPEIEQLVLRKGKTGAIDNAIKQNLVRTFQKVLSFVDGEALELIQILLGRWDLHNIKTILRGKHWALSDHEIIVSLIPAGQLNEILLSDLARQPDVNLVIDLLATWDHHYARPLRKNYAAYTESNNLAVLEVALEKAYYDHAINKIKLRSRNGRLVRDLLATSIDITNIITLLRIQEIDFKMEAEKLMEEIEEQAEVRKRANVASDQGASKPTPWWRPLRRILRARRAATKRQQPAMTPEEEEQEQAVQRQRELEKLELELKQPFFVPGGKVLTEQRFLSLTDKRSVQAVVREIEDTPYAEVVKKAKPALLKSGKISTLERALEELLIRKAGAMFRLDPFSIGVVIGYIWAKFNEVVNLRVILVGKTVGMPPHRIEEELILI